MKTQQLLEKLASGTATSAEYQQFTDWFDALSDTDKEQVLTSYETLLRDHVEIDIPPTLKGRIGRQISNYEKRQQQGRIFQIARWGAAAAVLLAVTWLIWPSGKTVRKPSVSIATTINDREPASQGAILTLSNGTTINLDSLTNGQIAFDGGMQVEKRGDRVIYSINAAGDSTQTASPRTTVYNMMQAPRGRQFQLILPDGSKVMLNAASSIRYPTIFEKKERKVSITGEAYFEIAKEMDHPFKISFHTDHAGSGEVEVLGTHFNINAYPDESVISTTLLSGKVKITPVDPSASRPLPGVIISPGMQGILGKTAGKQSAVKVQTANIEETMAWKNGRFLFNATSVEEIMRQLSRWYDVDINYPKNIAERKFTADLSRQTKLSEFLKVMELSGFHSVLHEKNLTISQ